MERWLVSLRNGNLATRGICLGLAVLAFYGLVSPVALFWGGLPGLWAAGAAAGFCLAGAATALVAGHGLRGSEHVLAALLVGTTARMVVPLALGLTCQLCGGPLAEAGVLYYLLMFYPVTLAVETTLSLPSRQQTVHESDVGSTVY